MAEPAKIINSKKFMWDGREYADAAGAAAAAKTYEQAGFEAQALEEGGRHLVYSRRLAVSQTTS
ncbi:MAG: hypothetical protein AAB359_08615 [Elusimicrobiota bacterium]